MTMRGHLWAVAFDDTRRAELLRDELTKLAWKKHDLNLRDVALAVRYPDGCFTLNGEPFYSAVKPQGGTLARLLAGLALGAPPLTGAAVGTLSAPIESPEGVGISRTFIQDVELLTKPGTSVLFVLDEEGNLDAILNGIRGMGGTVLKTNVDVERAKLIQSTLSGSADMVEPGGP